MNKNEKTENFLKNLFFIALLTTFGQNIIEYSSNKDISQEN
jgi:hypothetical protein